jgi:hypothetical protein
MNSPLSTPVALLVFNRPELTRRVLDVVRQARPVALYVVADGPRPDRPEDEPACAAVRAAVDAAIDWPCRVERLYAGRNLGCGRRVSSGIDWVFRQTSEAIFLEDDCLPDPTFFPFCAELLERYRNDPRVGQICGCTFVAPRLDRNTSYVFSRYGPVWGWASWRRAWQAYDFALAAWPVARAAGWLRRVSVSRREARWRTRIYDDLWAGRIDTWDYQWGFAKMQQGLLSAVPCTNLIENIGFDMAATHDDRHNRGLSRRTMPFPLSHPDGVACDEDFDRQFSRKIAPGWPRRIVGRCKRLLGLA